MPHLSPMNWFMVPMLMVFTLLTLSVILWWQFIPSFPSHYAHAHSSPKSWKWW
uniref:ATP synthase F0 subunit 8 n=1 Tax=Nereis pelagica TaxID=194549 RepID=UPI0030014567|nr:ATP synthase F0 subunit 8 [Nereis pelagica]